MLLLWLPWLLLSTCTNSAYCNGKPKDYLKNNEPIWSSEPTLLSRHDYGKLYSIGSSANKMHLLHVYGNMYQMGYAQGYLLRKEINEFLPELWDYILQQI